MDIWSDLTKWRGDQRIALLEAIQETGSVTHAAQRLNVSYKHAWDTLHALNNMSDQTLLVSQSGGRKGGGSALTQTALDLIHTYRILEAEHRARLPQAEANPWMRLRWQTSARNHFFGTITQLTTQGLEVLVHVTLNSGTTWQVAVTHHSLEHLHLSLGKEVHVLCKASALVLHHPNTPPSSDTPNNFRALIVQIHQREPHAEVSLQVGSHLFLYSICDSSLVHSAQLAEGQNVQFSCNPHALLLGIHEDI